MVFPIVLIVLGVLFLAHNLGYLRFAELKDIIGTWWPVILIAVGAAALVDRSK
jgi:hypothetical protein